VLDMPSSIYLQTSEASHSAHEEITSREVERVCADDGTAEEGYAGGEEEVPE
jgi:hypothetical protein